MLYYNGKRINRVGFLGIGKSNLGIYNYLANHYNFEVTVRASLPTDVSALSPKRVYFGKESLYDINEDILFVSPSARRDLKELKEAEMRGVILSSDAEFFFSKTNSDIYSVTGSDGKSTTTYLTSELLKKHYKSAVPCGNIGDAMTPHLDDPENTAYAAELSSFQLMYTKPQSERCVITNITKNHLNWHTSFQEYITSKKNILENSKERIINYDCVTTKNAVKDYCLFAVFSRRLSEDALKRQIKAELYITEKNRKILVSGDEYLDTEKILVGGNHNILNFMAAIAMSYGKCEKKDVLELAKSFGGLPHRCEFFGEYGGVKYYDSSIDSSPNRCLATLGSMQGRVILILGGRSKGLGFQELLPILAKKTKLVILTGETAMELEELIKSDVSLTPIRYKRIDDFYEAVKYASDSAQRGDTVLLSPAATSFDRFSNFEERGNEFKRYVKDLKTKGQ